MIDAYALLGVDPSADRGAIQSAYRALARQHHPDFGGDASHMALLNEAWALLGTPRRRAAYDAQRRTGIGWGRPLAATGRAAHAAISGFERPAADGGDKVVDFGRYEGWALQDIARHDPDYLEWLARAPIGRAFVGRIREVLGTDGRPTPGQAAAGRRTALGSR